MNCTRCRYFERQGEYGGTCRRDPWTEYTVITGCCSYAPAPRPAAAVFSPTPSWSAIFLRVRLASGIGCGGCATSFCGLPLPAFSPPSTFLFNALSLSIRLSSAASRAFSLFLSPPPSAFRFNARMRPSWPARHCADYGRPALRQKPGCGAAAYPKVNASASCSANYWQARNWTGARRQAASREG